jgi:hypothetical protein
MRTLRMPVAPPPLPPEAAAPPVISPRATTDEMPAREPPEPEAAPAAAPQAPVAQAPSPQPDAVVFAKAPVALAFDDQSKPALEDEPARDTVIDEESPDMDLPRSVGRAPTTDAWGDDEARVVPRSNGKKVVISLVAAIIAVAGLAVVARHQVRGAHDTAEGLELRPSASTATTAAPPATLPPAPPPAPTAAPTPTLTVAGKPPDPPPTATTTEATAPTPPTTAPAPPPAETLAVAPHAKPVRPRDPSAATAAPPPTPAPAPPAATGTSGGTQATNLTESAQSALEKNDKGAAVQMAYRATQRDPGNAEAWLTLGAAYESTGQRGLAIGAYRSCAKRAASHPRVSECKALAGIKDE